MRWRWSCGRASQAPPRSTAWQRCGCAHRPGVRARRLCCPLCAACTPACSVPLASRTPVHHPPLRLPTVRPSAATPASTHRRLFTWCPTSSTGCPSRPTCQSHLQTSSAAAGPRRRRTGGLGQCKWAGHWGIRAGGRAAACSRAPPCPMPVVSLPRPLSAAAAQAGPAALRALACRPDASEVVQTLATYAATLSRTATARQATPLRARSSEE